MMTGNMAVLTSPTLDSDKKSCILFFFNIPVNFIINYYYLTEINFNNIFIIALKKFKIIEFQKNGAYTSLRVVTQGPDGSFITVWDLTDTSVFADEEWLVGQVEVYNRNVKFEAVKNGEQNHGWVALDGIMVSKEDTCVTIPKEAQMSTVPPDTTTSVSSTQSGIILQF